MLLRNESRLKHIIHIKLVFDDKSVKELDLLEGDYVQVSYRKDCCMKNRVGVIKKIVPYHDWKCRHRELAMITLDMSTDLHCEVDTFSIADIIDITQITPVDCKCCCCKAPAVTEEGVDVSE